MPVRLLLLFFVMVNFRRQTIHANTSSIYNAPAAAHSAAPSNKGTAAKAIRARRRRRFSSPPFPPPVVGGGEEGGFSISYKWPSRPKPVTSVAAMVVMGRGEVVGKNEI